MTCVFLKDSIVSVPVGNRNAGYHIIYLEQEAEVAFL